MKGRNEMGEARATDVAVPDRPDGAADVTADGSTDSVDHSPRWSDRPDGPWTATPPSDDVVRRRLVELSEHPYLRTRTDALLSIADAVSTGHGAHDWARVDLGLLFGDDAVVHSEADVLARRASIWESVRNVSVFFPLMVTWLGIAAATKAYGALVDDHPPAARRPFIQLWEQRFTFPGVVDSPPWWVPSFSLVALVDFLAIFAVVVLSLMVARSRHRLDVTVVEEEAAVQNQLASAIGDAAVILARRSLASPTNFNETMNRVADQMVALQDRASSTAKAAQRSLDRGNDVLGSIDEVAARLSDAAGVIAGALEAVEPALQGTRLELQEIARSERSLAEQVSAGLSGLTSTQGMLSSSAKAISDSTERIDASFNAGLQAASAMHESARGTSDQLSRAASELGKLESVAKPMNEVLTRLDETAHALPQAAGGLEASAEKLDRTAGQLSAFGREVAELPAILRAVSEQLQSTASTQQRILESMGVAEPPRRRRWPFGRRSSRRAE